MIQDDDEGQALRHSQSHVTRVRRFHMRVNHCSRHLLLCAAIGSGCALMPAAALSVTVYSYVGGVVVNEARARGAVSGATVTVEGVEQQ